MLYRFQVRRNHRFLAPARELTRIFDFTWVEPVCCVSKISSDCGCQSKEIRVGMEVRLLSVGTRAFFLAASRLAFAASPLNPVAPNEKKTSGTQGNIIPTNGKQDVLKQPEANTDLLYFFGSELL